jgi:hypothetical protein
MLRDLGIEHKILSITCKNASRNDAMTTELDHLLPTFSPVNRTRCFSHALNLVAKSFIRQFDVDRWSDNLKKEDLNDEERSLLEFAGSIDEEEHTIAQENDEDEVIEEDDSLEGWIDEVDALMDWERQTLEESIRPVRRMLVKVRDRYTI